MKTGLEILKEYIKNAPEQPGVYRMLDENEQVLYVGKAKNIKKRIFSYSQIARLPLRLQRMVSQIKRMEFFVVESENKALILENELIKKLEPKYNILLKDDKSFPYLCLDNKADFPSLKKFRGKRDKRYKYFGPFAGVGALNNTLDTVQKIFGLRVCKDSEFKNRTRPCMLYQIKRCAAPCVGKISKEEYQKAVALLTDFLDGKDMHLQQQYSAEMYEASQQLNYEKALVLRDKIKALTMVQNTKNLAYENIKSADVVGLFKQDNLVCVEVLLIRGSQNCGNMSFFPRQTEDASESEILEAFLSSFYAKHLVPEEIVVSHPLEAKEFLESALNAKIIYAQKGKYAELSKTAVSNAQMALGQKLVHSAGIKENLVQMQKVFELEKMPQRIEIYDNSHIQGAYAVGAMVVATPEGFDKKQYRKFNIKNEQIAGDDFAMMKEVLLRRFEHIEPNNKPDVVLLDGGLGQLNAVYEALKDKDLSGINIIAISKGQERNAGKELYHQKGKAGFALEFASALAFYMQNLRDEAHRFAIGTHRNKRAKSIIKSELDAVEAIGAKRKKDLLNYFGSVRQIAEAEMSDLQKVKGISKKTAEKIYNHFHF